MRRSEHDFVGWAVEQRAGCLRDPFAQPCNAGGLGFARLGENYHALGATLRVARAEYGDAALPHARDVADHALDLFGVDVPTGANDDVLRTAGDVDVAAGDVGEITAVEPVTVEQLAILRGI